MATLAFCILCFLYIGVKAYTDGPPAAAQRRTPRTRPPRGTLLDGTVTPQPSAPFRPPATLRLRHLPTRGAYTHLLMDNWRRAITGLVQLADDHLRDAHTQFRNGQYRAAVETAFTSVENIARAMIHFCGGKPDPEPGQGEALRLLSPPFTEPEKREFDHAVNDVICLHYNRLVLNHHDNGAMATTLFDTTGNKQILDSASNVVKRFTQLIRKYYEYELNGPPDPEASDGTPPPPSNGPV